MNSGTMRTDNSKGWGAASWSEETLPVEKQTMKEIFERHGGRTQVAGAN